MTMTDLQFVAALGVLTGKLLVLCLCAMSITASLFLIVSVIKQR
ncbi:hypothetical protein [Bradyrhizobium sp. SZCCHNR3118]|nr:hypothetical protein [Bradyrhizobium sp. SZCCHNR3118]